MTDAKGVTDGKGPGDTPGAGETRRPGETKGVDITLMGRQFRVSCPVGEEQELLDAAKYLDQRMRDIREGGRVVANERVAIMAALNIAHEMLSLRGGGGGIQGDDLRRRIQRMSKTLEQCFFDQEKLF